MWKLIDCGTYPWFVRETKKYFHCVYSLTGETKKLKVKRNEIPMYMMSHKAYLGYLRTWPLSISPCILDRKSAKFYIDLWKNKNKTNVMKEITKQLRTI
tara:strand:+ start:809 stop:1105 length:297 start_codon:yes stop_codon:yes gene_type:complete